MFLEMTTRALGFLWLARALNRPGMPGDRLSAGDGSVAVIPVAPAITLRDEKNPVRLVSIGAGPHGSAALGVHALAAGVFFVSDLHVPVGDDGAPRAWRAETECWFAAWAVRELPAGTVVANSHSTATTPVSRFESYLTSDVCREVTE